MMTRRRCSRFASAKVRLFLKPAKGCERFFKKMKKKSVERTTKGREREGTPYYILYRVYKKKKKETRREKRNKDHNEKNCPHTIKHADNLFIKF